MAIVVLVGLPLLAACDPAPPSAPAFVSAHPIASTPWVMDGKVWSIAPVGNRVVVAGEFTTVENAGSGQPQTVTNVFAYDPSTGQIDPAFHPVLDGRALSVAASSDGTSVFVGGEFKTVNGVTVGGLAKLDLATGEGTAGFSPAVVGFIYSVKRQGPKLYIGGAFSRVRNLTRNNLAAVDASTGVADPTLNLDVSETIATTGTGASALPFVYRLAVSPDASKLVVLGNFKKVGGLDRAQLAIVNLSGAGASVSSWQTDVTAVNLRFFFLRDLAISPDGTYFVNTAWFHEGNPLMDAATRWDLTATGPGQQPTWIDATGGDSLFSVAVTDRAVYVGGHPRWLNNGNTPAFNTAGPAAVSRPQVAALDPVNGVPYTWAPGQDRGFGATSMVATPGGLFIGSDTEHIAGEYHPRLSFFPTTGGTVVPVPKAAALPTTVYSAGPDGVLRSRSYNGSTFGAVTTVAGGGIAWAQARGSFMVNGQLYVLDTNGALSRRSFNGSAYGAASTLPAWTTFGSATGAFYDNGRMYFTVAGDPQLYYRYLEPQSGIVGYDLFVASGNGDGFDWRAATGLTLVGGRLYAGRGDGTLYRSDWRSNRPVAGSTVAVDTSGTQSLLWRTPTLFTLVRS